MSEGASDSEGGGARQAGAVIAGGRRSRDGGAGPATIAGLDVGGAHVKGARVVDGRLVDAFQIASPMWSGTDRLAAALAEARDRLGQAERVAITITAELADAFASRRDGLAAVADMIAAAFPADAVAIWGGRAGFLSLDAVAAHVADVASANWHATASLVAARLPEALLVDIGSTTADIIPVAGGRPVGRGYGDAERLVAGELLYTGTTRTFVMAIAERVPFAGHWQPLMNEYFASMADVRRLTGELDDGVDQHATADGRGKSVEESRARFARMLGRDVDEASPEAFAAAARYLGERQLRALHDAAAQVLSGAPLSTSAPVVGAGIGGFLTRALAERLGRRWIGFADLVPADTAAADWATRAAPAVAVALLAAGAR